MAFICKEISFGKTNIFFSLILVGAILLTSLTYVESLTKFFAEINYHPVIYSMTYSLGLCLSFSFLIIYKIRNKSVKDNILPHNKDHQISRTFTGVSSTKTHMTFKEKFLWILLTSVINYIAYIFFCIYWMNETNFLNCWGITIIFMSLFSNLILKIKLYRHHYLSIIVVVLLGFSYNIAMDKFSKENMKKNYDCYLVQFMTECLISLMNVMYKYLVETKYILSYEILLIEGLIEFVLGIITLIITTSAGIVDNFWDFIDEVDSHEIAILIIITLIQFLLYTTEIIIIVKFSPFHVLLINILRDYILFFVFFDTKNLAASIYVVFAICICIFMILVFIEIIELNFFGLSTMTKKNIILRSKKESIDVGSFHKDDIVVNIQGYTLNFEEDKSIELTDLSDL